MSTSEPDFNPEDYEGLQPAQTTIHAAELRKLRKAAKENDDNKARIAALERREAFARAGVPLDHPATDYLIRGYQGDLTPEAIKVEAVKLGVIAASTATPEEIAAHGNAQAAAAGATPPQVGPDYQARFQELASKQFAPSDDVGRQKAITEMAELARQAGARFQVNN